MADSATDLVNQFRYINDTANELGVRPELVHAVINQESRGNQGALSPKGAIGLMQLMPGTAKEMGVDPNDWQQNVRGGVGYLKKKLDENNGDEKLALAAYNAGQGAVKRSGGIPQNGQTPGYVANITKDAGPAPSASDLVAQFRAAQPGSGSVGEIPAEEKSVGGFLRNSLESAGGFAGNLVNTVTHPLNTVSGLGKLAAGIVEDTFVPDSVMKNHPNLDTRAHARAYADYMDKRYGGLKQIGDTLYKDPFGVMGDVSAAAGAVGGGLGGASTAAELGGATKAAGSLGRAANMAAKVGENFNPTNIPVAAAREFIQPAAEAIAQHVGNVNMQIPKALRRRESENPHFNNIEAVLDENRGTNPFTRFRNDSKVEANIKNRGAVYQETLDNYDARNKPNLRLEPVDQALADVQGASGENLNAPPLQRAIQGLRDDFKNNNRYGQDRFGTVMVNRKYPAQAVAGPTGEDLYIPPGEETVPDWQKVGRDFRPQSANALETLKRNTSDQVSFGEKSPMAMEEPALVTAKKAARGAIKDILEQNVTKDYAPDKNLGGVKEQNVLRQRSEMANNALQEAILTNMNKRHVGLAESALGYAAPIAFIDHQPLTALAMSAPAIYSTLVKHPASASAVAAAAHAIGTYSMDGRSYLGGPSARLWNLGGGMRPAIQAATTATQLNQSIKDAGVQYNPTISALVDDFRNHAGRTGQELPENWEAYVAKYLK